MHAHFFPYFLFCIFGVYFFEVGVGCHTHDFMILCVANLCLVECLPLGSLVGAFTAIAHMFCTG